MKLTEKTIKQEVETTETICEITRDEFDKLCANVTAKFVVDAIDCSLDIEDLAVGIAMTKILAEYIYKLEEALFNPENTNNPKTKNKKEEK